MNDDLFTEKHSYFCVAEYKMDYIKFIIYYYRLVFCNNRAT